MTEYGIPRGRKTVTRTIRIDEEVDRNLAELAFKERISVNYLVNNALRRYVEWDYLATKYGVISNFIPASKKQMDYLTDEEVIELAEWVGKSLFKEYVMFFFKCQDLESMLKSIRLLGSSGNFQYEDYVDGDVHTVICKHGCGPKWSLYYETVFRCVFGDIGVAAKVESTEDQVLIRLNAPKHRFLNPLYEDFQESVHAGH